MRKFKTALALLLTLALAVQLSTAALADDATSGTCGENVTWSLNTDTGVLTISGEGEIEYQEIDEPPWYSQREYITEVVIEEGVTGISDYAFLYCLNLASVTIPASVTYIGYLPFVPCPRLTKILVSEENEYYTSVDGVLFDKDMTELICYPAGKADTSYAIPSGVAIIDIGAFGYSFNLTSVTVPETVTDIGLEAFVCCTALTKILVSDSSTAYCSADGVLFSKDMTSLICYPEGKTDVSYTIPDGVTYIEHAAFAFCTSLTDVTIPKSVTAIGDNAFYSYDKEILSEEINEGSYHGFYTIFLECATLSDVYYCGSEDEWNAIEIGNYNTGLETATIHYNSVAEDTDGTGDSGDSEIISGTCGENLTWTLVDGVLTISGTGEMEDTLSPSGIPWNSQRSSITSVIIEDGVTTISSFAFWDCSSLTSVTIPDSVTSIGDAAFYGCTSLSDVYYGGSEAEWNAVGIDDYNECLTSATIHFNDGTTSGGSTGDSGSTSETLSGICGDSLTWTLEDGVLTISGSGYMYDYEEVGTPWLSLTDSITAVVIEDGVLGISTYAFYGCVNLTSITWPDNLLYIGKCAFDECNSLEDITLPSGLTTLGTSFYGSVYYNDETNWTDNALYIDGWLAAVSDCSEESFVVETGTVGIAMGVLASYDLQSVHIPDSVKYICDYAFAYCEALTDVYYSGSEEDWNAIEIGTENDCLLNATIAYDSGSEGSTTPGDLNGDGEVNASDLTILARHVGKVETMEDETYLANADVTGDGNVDASDLTKLAQYVGKIISSLD